MCCLLSNWLKLWPSFWEEKKKTQVDWNHNNNKRLNKLNESRTVNPTNERGSQELGAKSEYISWAVDTNNRSAQSGKHYADNLFVGQLNNKNNNNFSNKDDSKNHKNNALADLAHEQSETGKTVVSSDCKTNLPTSIAGSKLDIKANMSSEQAQSNQTTKTSIIHCNTDQNADPEQSPSLSSASNVYQTNTICNINNNNKTGVEEDKNNNNDEVTLIRQQEAALFRIRTSNRRHLDFDELYELSDTSAPQRSRWHGPFHFIQAADCQFGMIDSYVHHRTEPGWKEEIELCENLVKVCNQMEPRPKFMIICGDLIDSLPGSEIGRKQVVDFKRIFTKLIPEIPLVCVCGNHDVGDEPTEKTVSDYRQTFGDDYFYFTKNDILFIVINSQFYQHRQNVEQIALEQDKWLEDLLAKCKLFRYSFIFEHIPWFLQQPEEENDYFNIKKEVRSIWLEKFRRAGVTKIFCGHYHRNAGGWYGDMELIVTSAIGAQCGNDKNGIRIVKVYEDSIKHHYYAMPDIPIRIEL